jgi:hypothetical protein
MDGVVKAVSIYRSIDRIPNKKLDSDLGDPARIIYLKFFL